MTVASSFEEYKAVVDKKQRTLESFNHVSSDGCPECGVAFSFYFNTQFHKKGCSVGEKQIDEVKLE